jgi:RND family efflux transporter MFP subunit
MKTTTIEPASPPQATPAPPINKPAVVHVARSPRRLQSRRLRGLAWKLSLAAIGVVLLAWSAKHWLGGNTEAAAEITATVKRASLPITVVERGELESSQTVDVRCEVEGYQNKIVSILPEGTHVKKDEVVVRFDAEQLTRNYADQEVKFKQAEGKAKAAKGELEVQTNKAEGEIDKAQTALTLAEIERNKYLEGEYKVEVDDKQGDIKLAERDLHEAQEKLEKHRAMVKKGFQPPQLLQVKELEVAKSQYALSRNKAKLEVLEKFTFKGKQVELQSKADDARREVKRAKSSGKAAVEKTQSDLDAAEVTTRLEKTSLERLKKQLEHTVVKAPQDGILVYSKDRFWDQSARIQPGAMVHFQQTLFSLPDLGKMQVKVKIHEAMVKKLKPGQKAEIRVESAANLLLHGTVEKVATLADSMGYWDERGVKEYVTIVKVDELPPDAGLKPGMTAEVKILVKELPNALVVPVQAVSQKEGQHYAYVIGARGIERREVTVGENNEKFVEIKSGLEEGEKVALDARARIAAETKVSEGKTPEPPKLETPPPQSQPQPKAAPAAPTPPKR